jgi:hypothetical protein
MSWLRSTKSLSMRKAACAAALALSVCGVSAHAEGTGCAAFAWPIDADKAALADPGIAGVASGAALGPLKPQTFALKLQPVSSVKFTVAPGGKKAPADNGGLVTFEAPGAPGTYQVTLSDAGWIDLVQNGASLKSSAHSGATGCDGVRKSVRFAIANAPVVLQLSGVKGEAIRIAISAVK